MLTKAERKVLDYFYEHYTVGSYVDTADIRGKTEMNPHEFDMICKSLAKKGYFEEFENNFARASYCFITTYESTNYREIENLEQRKFLDERKMSKNCFFISPIGNDDSEERKHTDKVMNYILKPVCGNIEYCVIRADEITSANKISEDIINHLENDEIAVADLTGLNPNVFYEIGYRDAKSLPTIHIAEKGTKLPFDVIDDRTIFFDLTDLENVDKFKKRLSKTIESLLSDFLTRNKKAATADRDGGKD